MRVDWWSCDCDEGLTGSGGSDLATSVSAGFREVGDGGNFLLFFLSFFLMGRLEIIYFEGRAMKMLE